MTTLTMQDEKRIEIIQRVVRDELTVVKAAMVLGISERQCYRIKRRVKEHGAKGVIHANRGRPCKHRIQEKTVNRILQLARGKYRGFNDHHLTEKLKEHEQIELSREKVRRILRLEGIATPRKRRPSKRRSRRERRTCGYFLRSLKVTVCPSPSIATVTRCSGPTENRPSMSS